MQKPIRPHAILSVLLVIILVLSACKSTTEIPKTSAQATKPERNQYNTISSVMLKKAAQWPVLTDNSLPDWKGTALTPEYLGRAVKAKDIEEIAKNGFHYVRVHYGYRQMADQFALKPIETSLEELDQLIGWGIEYGVHINLTLYDLPGSRDDIMKNKEHYSQAIAVWEMLAKRYTNVPAAALSYNLLNEPSYDVFTEMEYATFANKLAEAIWKHDAQKMIVSDGMLGNGWDGAVASKPIDKINPKIVQSLHFYPWHSLRRSAHLSLLHWPYDNGVVVNNMISSGGQPLVVKGAWPKGTEISVYLTGIDNVNNGGSFVLQADGTDVDKQTLDGFIEGGHTKIIKDDTNSKALKAEFGDNGNYNGYEVQFLLPKAVKTLTFKVKGEVNTRVFLRELNFLVPTSTEGYYTVVDNTKKPQGFDYRKGNFRSIYIACANVYADQGSTVTVAADDSITSTPAFPQVDVFDLDSMKSYFTQWRKWADQHHVRIMCNEFDIPMALPQKSRMAFLKTLLDIFAENHMPWSVSCELVEGWGPIALERELELGTLVLAPDSNFVHRDGYIIDQSALDFIKQYRSNG